MVLSIYDRFITRTDSGATIGGASVTVTAPGTGALAQLYEDRDGEDNAANPFTADSDGRVQFYLAPGRYNISATGGGVTINYPDVLVGLEFVDGVQSVETIADLRALVPDSIGRTVYLLGHTLPPSGSAGGGGVGAGGGGGVFRSGIAGTTTDNNGTQIVVNSTWCWRRAEYERATPRMFGAIGDGIADDTDALEAALLAEGAVLLPIGTYRLTRQIPWKPGFSLVGEDMHKSVLVFDFPGDLISHPTGSTLFWYTGENVPDCVLSNFTAIHSDTTEVYTRLIWGMGWSGAHLSNIRTDAFRAMVFTNCSDINFENITRLAIPTRLDRGDDEDGGGLASLQSCTRVRGKKLVGFGLAEGVDFGGGDDVQLEDYKFYARDDATANEAVDIGGVSNAVISNGYTSGFGKSLHIKDEVSIERGCRNITVDNIIAEGFHGDGVLVALRSVTTPWANGGVENVKISNCTFESNEALSRGVRITSQGTAEGSGGVASVAKDVHITNVTAKTNLEAFRSSSNEGLKINGGHFESATTVGVYFSNSSVGLGYSIDPRITGATAVGNGIGAIFAENTISLVVDDCRLNGSGVTRGFNGLNNLNVKVTSNEIDNVTRAITQNWSDAAYLVSGTDGIVGWDFSGNTCHDYSENGIMLTLTGTALSGASAGEYIGGRIVNNDLGNQNSSGVDIGLSFATLGAGLCDYVVVAGNTCIAFNAIANESNLGPNSVVVNNIDLAI